MWNQKANYERYTFDCKINLKSQHFQLFTEFLGVS